MNKERPIRLKAHEVRGILDGRQTQLRRVFKPWRKTPFENLAHTDPHLFSGRDNDPDSWGYPFDDDGAPLSLSHYAPLVRNPGERLWVREAWQFYGWSDDGEPQIRYAADNATRWCGLLTGTDAIHASDAWETLSADANYNFDDHARDRKWRPSIHMPRYASRIDLEITGVRVERLQDISEADCKAEGAHGGHGSIPSYAYSATPREHYRHIWETINGPDSWSQNPWVWVVEFKRIRPA